MKPNANDEEDEAAEDAEVVSDSDGSESEDAQGEENNDSDSESGAEDKEETTKNPFLFRDEAKTRACARAVANKSLERELRRNRHSPLGRMRNILSSHPLKPPWARQRFLIVIAMSV